MLINHVIDGLKEGDDLDLFETFYSEMIDEDDFNSLSIIVKQNYHFHDISRVFGEALN